MISTLLIMKILITLILINTLVVFSSLWAKQSEGSSEWISLFNGKDLEGWDTYISYVPKSGETVVKGVNNDPNKVFTVVDGLIRISGQEWGAITSREEFENYHLKLEFKWGELKWPPRLDMRRDSGLLYHCVGPHGAQNDHWMRSHEFQIQEGDTGDYYSLAGASLDIKARKISFNESHRLQYDPNGQNYPLDTVTFSRRVIKSHDNENPTGEWNVVELICEGDVATHIVNDEVVFQATASRQESEDGQSIPLTRGKLQIQSEGAEIFLRNILIRNLKN